jgi:hypothetical protein
VQLNEIVKIIRRKKNCSLREDGSMGNDIQTDENLTVENDMRSVA